MNFLNYLHRLAALVMAVFGIYVFVVGGSTKEYRIFEDGSLIDASDIGILAFKEAKAVLTFKAGFDFYRTITFGVSSLFLLLDLVFSSGFLTLPAIVLVGAEILNDFSDFCLAVVLIFIYIGGYSAAAYGITYLSLLVVEFSLWVGTCKFHESCRIAHHDKMVEKREKELLLSSKKVS